MSSRPAPEAFARRRAGVLLHPTALPGGPGKLGKASRQFVTFLAECGMTVWQTLPIGPPHDDRSPYQSLSAHAGNPELIDLDELCAGGLLEMQEMERLGRRELMQLAGERLASGDCDGAGGLTLDTWREFEQRHSGWLEDFCLFQAIRETLPGCPWPRWPDPLRGREPSALAKVGEQQRDLIRRVSFEQYLFHHQWQALKAHARQHGVLLFGDIPIFVAHDSADVWANPELFHLDDQGQPTVVAGVPPDYFSAEGQHWGNPIYDWHAMAMDGYQWWLGRLASQREHFDLIRLDHFRGLQAYWEIPAADPRPVNGHWVAGPADDFLRACFERFPDLPLIAENLGIIGEDVEALRRRFSLPGMTVLQFGFDGNAGNPHLLHNHQEGDVVYTGTHDNDTTLGWYQSLEEHARQHVNHYLRLSRETMPWSFIQAAMGSVSRLVIIPMQDLLCLDSSARFNTPGTTTGNWLWQMPADYHQTVGAGSLAAMVRLYGR